ncbi:glycosyltransferase family 9 protein [Thalassospira lucentensis]|uniref:glycosyltransferase family 9 protein n=1 Tax=Thalassospira lucentensis TaxID=168935 RepID=UPI0003B458CB|nr:glycosyltransferase family 9 protein [Thalassospira lucentensis]RCK30558.1 hypothetical protein TH1_01125 [Thalassospira lucentensis MCCC 1A00383 = DSM 14000]
MGLGGNLIWTGVFDAIHDQMGQVAIACDTPMITDVLSGYWYRRGRSYQNDPIFLSNPDIGHVDVVPKGKICHLLDVAFEKLISRNSLRRRWESFVTSRTISHWKNAGAPLFVHIDMRNHSYARAQTKKKTYWKSGGCAAHVIARTFGVSVKVPKCKFFPTDSENLKIKRILAAHCVSEQFVAIEPETNRDWFGDLRAWKIDRWQALVYQIKLLYPNLDIVQLGVGDREVLTGVTDLTGRTSFREAASLIARSRLFIGTEGGLMHLAASMGTPSVILWGGITLPEFAGYPDQHHIICHYVDCAPCGNLGWCDYDRKCMNSIEVGEVVEAVRSELN